MARIKIKNSVTPGSAPAGLSLGEMAVNIADKKIFIGNAVEGVVTLHDQNNIVTSVNGQTGDVTVSGSSSGVTGLVAGTGISISGPTGNVTITNTGVVSFNGTTGAIEGIEYIYGMTGSIHELIPVNRGNIYLYDTSYRDGNINYAQYSNYVENWTSVSGLTYSKNITDPFGVSNNAYTLTRNVVNATSTASITFNDQDSDRCVSFYVRGVSADYVRFGISEPTYVPGATFNIELLSGSGTVFGNGTSNIGITGLSDLAWNRVKITHSSQSKTINSFYVEMTYNYTGFSGAAVGFYGLQLETGITGTTYIDNPTASPIIGPGVTLNAIGVSYENIAVTNTPNTFSYGATFGGNIITSGSIIASGATFTGNIYAQNIVNSINGYTGTVTGFVKADISNDFSAQQEFSDSIIINNIYVRDPSVTMQISQQGADLLLYNTINDPELAQYGRIFIGDSNYNYDGLFVGINDTPYTEAFYVKSNRSGITMFSITQDTTGGWTYGQEELIRLNANAGRIILDGAGLEVNSGATFTGNIYAPNIVTSVNGQTGDVTVSGGGSGFTYTSSAPSLPSIGDRWMDSDTGKEYVYVNDGSSSQWIEPVSSNGLVGVTYTSATNLLEFGLTATFSGSVTSDGGYRITSNTINAQSGTTYSLLSTDNGKIITMNNGSAITLTVPSGLPIGFNTTVIQLGAGQVGITSSSTTLNSFESKYKLAGQHAAASIISYTTNVFNVAGGLTA